MSITCSLHYNNSDSLIQEVSLQCVPSVGETLYLDGNTEGVVKSIHHEISVNNKVHKVVVNYGPR
ncbi:MAG: hypothetical protein RL571_1779 [Pseudomonadota bacterium]|jgi:hypothetical protein